MSFVPARRDLAFLRLLLWGESGGGKSFTALLQLSYLVAALLGHPEWVAVDDKGWPTVDPRLEPHIAVIDGEARLREYCGGRPFHFSIEEPLDFQEGTIIPILDNVRRGGFKGLLFDPFSHVWQGPGGILQLQGELGGDFKAWGPAKATYRRILGALLSVEAHVIATARAKVERVIEGKKVVSQGLHPVGEDGAEYEFSLVGRMSAGGDWQTIKSSIPGLETGEVMPRPGLSLAKRLGGWLHPTEGAPGAFGTVREAILKATDLESAGAAKALYLKAAQGSLTAREGDLLRMMLVDLGARLAPKK